VRKRENYFNTGLSSHGGNFTGANMHTGIQSLLRELKPEVPFEYFDFGSPDFREPPYRRPDMFAPMPF